MSGIRVRKARSADVDALRSIKLEASTILLTQLGHTLEEIGAWHRSFVTPEYFIRQTRSPNSLYLVEEDGRVQGVAGLSLADNGKRARGSSEPLDTDLFPLEDSYVYFSNLYVLTPGAGLGSRLMTYRLGVVENFNVDHLICHVHEKNERARRFVEHYGFEAHDWYAEERLGSIQVVYRRSGDL